MDCVLIRLEVSLVEARIIKDVYLVTLSTAVSDDLVLVGVEAGSLGLLKLVGAWFVFQPDSGGWHLIDSPATLGEGDRCSIVVVYNCVVSVRIALQLFSTDEANVQYWALSC